jgi:5-methylcytosine-specific restriction endonuclease McrA
MACREKRRQKRLRAKQRWRTDSTVCRACGKPKENKEFSQWISPDFNYCIFCFFKRASYDHFRTMKYWQQLANIFLIQRGRCAISGRPLLIGDNVSLDHRIPLSRGGRAELANVWWVATLINVMKNDRFLHEFLAIYRQILKFQKSPERRAMLRRLKLAANNCWSSAD